jgi:hypothetical protein
MCFIKLKNILSIVTYLGYRHQGLFKTTILQHNELDTGFSLPILQVLQD